MKKPDEIKKALECCFQNSEQCADCPYYPTSCDRELVRDAREYIRQLETERDALIEEIGICCACWLCKYGRLDSDQWPCAVCDYMRSRFEWRGLPKEG